jgi:hypothetical protein
VLVCARHAFGAIAGQEVLAGWRAR